MAGNLATFVHPVRRPPRPPWRLQTGTEENTPCSTRRPKEDNVYIGLGTLLLIIILILLFA
jgi:hypothetical protein